jgi:hypothetical protein
MHKITFTSSTGLITLYLPDDMAAGDTISGTVYTAPKGTSDDERSKNQDVLNGTVIDLGDGNKIPADRPTFRWTPVIPKPSTTTKYLLKMIPIYPNMSGSGAPANVPIAATPPANPTSFTLPTLGQTGRPVAIRGPFDGDASNTSCTVGGEPVTVIAESPRKAVITAPTTVIGSTNISLNQRGITISGSYRNIDVKLSAPKTNLLKGETTTLTIDVSGLQGVETDIPLKLECSGAVNMEGGNSQALRIQPSKVNTNGNFTQSFTLNATQTGGWMATGTVQTAPAQNPCYLAGQTVHVENNYGGSKGNWVIGIKEQDGTTGYVHLGGDSLPKLKFCDWIKIGGCHTDENGLIWVDGYEKTDDPTKIPPTKTDEPKPPKPPEVPVPVNPPPVDTSVPPCKDGDTRDATVDTKEFDVMDENSTVSFQIYTDKDSAAAAAKNMSDFWKGAKKVGDILKKGRPEGSTIADWVLAYLDRGSEILDAVLASRLKDASVNKVTVDAIITVKHITATCTTTEVCEKGKWVKKKTYKETVESSFVRPFETVTPSDGAWDQIVDSTARVDRKKLGQWAQDWLHKQLDILKTSSDKYAEFKAKCK